MTKSTGPSTPSGSSETQQRRRQITSYKNTTTSPATDTRMRFSVHTRRPHIRIVSGAPEKDAPRVPKSKSGRGLRRGAVMCGLFKGIANLEQIRFVIGQYH